MLKSFQSCLIISVTILTGLFIITGCEEESNPPVLVTSLTATFTGDFNCPGCDPGILFYSDLDGNVLWSGTWTGNDTVEATIETGFPERMTMTTVTYNEEYNRVYITSNMNVKRDSYIWYGGGADYRWREYTGDVILNFENDPGHQGYHVSSKYNSRRSSSGSLYSDYTKSLYTWDDNLFVRIDPLNDVPCYTWITDVEPGDTITIDLSDMTDMLSKTISLPSVDMERVVYVRGYNTDYYSGYYRVNSLYPYEIESDDIDVYYPGDLFSGHRTYIFVDEEPYPTANYWYHSVMGDIPSSLNRLDTEFSFVDDDSNDVAVEITGDYTQMLYSWTYENMEGRTYSWTVYTDLSAISLPEIPQSVRTAYSDFDVDSLVLTIAGVHSNDNLSYDEYIELFFKSGMGFYEIITESMARYKDPEGLRPVE